MKKFYIIETTYIGPNQSQDRYIDADTIEIWTRPLTDPLTGDEVICGATPSTSGDWASEAHGVYETEDLARAAIEQIWDGVRWEDSDQNPWEIDPGYWEAGCVAIAKPGLYHPIGREATENFIYDDRNLGADSTDQDLERLAADAEQAAREEYGWSLMDTLRAYERRRDTLRDEASKA